jgi:creatinine amidohydrolase
MGSGSMIAMNLDELRWPDLAECFRCDPLAIVPVGSVEQHGPHAPLGTDYMIAEEIAKEAAARANAICCPVISVSVSSHHRHFPGTLYVPARIFEDYLLHYSLSLAFNGVKKLIFVNGHGGNTASIGGVSTTLKENHGVLAIMFQWWTDTPRMAEIFPGGRLHMLME